MPPFCELVFDHFQWYSSERDANETEKDYLQYTDMQGEKVAYKSSSHRIFMTQKNFMTQPRKKTYSCPHMKTYKQYALWSTSGQSMRGASSLSLFYTAVGFLIQRRTRQHILSANSNGDKFFFILQGYIDISFLYCVICV